MGRISVPEILAKLLRALRKQEEADHRDRPFIVLKTKDGLLSLIPNDFGPREVICRPIRTALTPMAMSDPLEDMLLPEIRRYENRGRKMTILEQETLIYEEL